MHFHHLLNMAECLKVFKPSFSQPLPIPQIGLAFQSRNDLFTYMQEYISDVKHVFFIRSSAEIALKKALLTDVDKKLHYKRVLYYSAHGPASHETRLEGIRKNWYSQ